MTSEDVKKDQLLDTIRKVEHDSGMAGKAITLDEEAGKHLVEPRRGTAGYLLRNAKKYVLSEETLDAIEEQVRARSESPARSETP